MGTATHPRRTAPLRARQLVSDRTTDADSFGPVPSQEPWMREIARQHSERKARRSWFARHKKLTIALAVLVAVALGAGIAWALLKKDMPVSGNISGEDGVAAAVFTSSTSPSGPCTWSVVNGTDALTINAAKVTSGVTHRCRNTLTLRNDGNTEMRVQSFAVTSTTGTVISGFDASQPAKGCGVTLAPGAVADVRTALDLSNVPVGSSGTLSGRLSLVDAASFSSTACSSSLT